MRLMRFTLLPAVVLLAWLCLLPVIGFGQAASNTKYEYVEELPEYPGGFRAIVQFLADNIHYPTDALRDNITGKVYVRFVVDTTGQVVGPVVMRGIGGGCDVEAVRVIKRLARFKPGRQNGKAVSVYFNVPVAYKISKEEMADWDPAFLPDSGVVYRETEVPVRLPGERPPHESGLYTQPVTPGGKPGVVVLEVWTDASGRRTRLSVIHSLSPEADSAALAAMRAAPAWQPARQAGQAVPVMNERYIVFGAPRQPDIFYAPAQPAVYIGREPIRDRFWQLMRYPTEARQNKEAGTVYVRVIVDTLGVAHEPVIVQGISPALDAEALRLSRLLETFQPARHEGHLVPSYVLLPVNFSLEAKK
jgi:TonB family protein